LKQPRSAGGARPQPVALSLIAGLSWIVVSGRALRTGIGASAFRLVAAPPRWGSCASRP